VRFHFGGLHGFGTGGFGAGGFGTGGFGAGGLGMGGLGTGGLGMGGFGAGGFGKGGFGSGFSLIGGVGLGMGLDLEVPTFGGEVATVRTAEGRVPWTTLVPPMLIETVPAGPAPSEAARPGTDLTETVPIDLLPIADRDPTLEPGAPEPAPGRPPFTGGSSLLPGEVSDVLGRTVPTLECPALEGAGAPMGTSSCHD
jgi:hypothetical protein